MLKFRYSGQYGWETQSMTGFYFLKTYPTPDNPKTLRAVNDTHSCREYFIKSLRASINGSSDPNLPMARRAYALVSLGRPYSQNLESWQHLLRTFTERSLYIINSFERHHKWQLTKAYPVECTNIDMDIPMMFYNGPKRWTMSPYLMSIWTLMIRSGRNEWLPKKLLELDHEALVRQILIAAPNAKDGNQIRQTMRHWDLFMSSYKELFGRNNRRYHWSISHLNGLSSRPEGILKLCTGTTNYIDLKNRWNKIVKEAKVK